VAEALAAFTAAARDVFGNPSSIHTRPGRRRGRPSTPRRDVPRC
jgi:cysteine sulfinate desulfinase/cysteine desulfurase-like protein